MARQKKGAQPAGQVAQKDIVNRLWKGGDIYRRCFGADEDEGLDCPRPARRISAPAISDKLTDLMHEPGTSPTITLPSWARKDQGGWVVALSRGILVS